jgi:acetyl esterase/lipase
MDMYAVENLTSAPAVIYVHGGAWTSEDKNTVNGDDIHALVQAGFVVFSINYRLAPEYRFPAMIEDVKCAVRSIRAHAQEYHVAPDHIGAVGESAGGHLVSLLGTSDKSAGFDVGEYLEYSSRVQAVVDMFGLADLTADFSGKYKRFKNVVFGTFDIALASPVTYISADDPPFLILHGEHDMTVPIEQSRMLQERLALVNVPATLVVVKNADHGFKPVSLAIDPTRAEIIQMIVDFFIRTLKR